MADSDSVSDGSDDDTRPLLADPHGSLNATVVVPVPANRCAPWWPASLRPSNMRLLLFLILLILFATIDTVAFKVFTNKISNYLYFFHQVLLLAVLVVFTAATLIRIHVTKQITAEMRAFPLWKFALIGFLDLCASLMMMFGSNGTAGPVQVLLRQTPIPFTMMVSIVFLKAKYRWWQYLAASLIICGVLLSVISDIVHPQPQDVTNALAVVFVLAFVPVAVSSVLKEAAFKAGPMDLYYLNAWVTAFQWGFGMVALPLSAPLQNWPIATLWENWRDAIWCWFYGVNVLPGDQCEGKGMIVVVLYIVVACLFNVYILLVMQYGSAALMWVATTVSVPLANFAFMMHFILGDKAQDFSWFNLGALVLVTIGLVVFNQTRSEDSEKAPVSEKRELQIL